MCKLEAEDAGSEKSISAYSIWSYSLLHNHEVKIREKCQYKIIQFSEWLS